MNYDYDYSFNSLGDAYQFHLSYVSEGFYCFLCSIFEYYFPNIYNNTYTSLIRGNQNSISETIVMMSNIQFSKCITFFGIGIIYLIVLYIMFLYSDDIPELTFNFKKLASLYYMVIFIIILDIIPYIFIFPSISGFTYITNLAVNWNSSQYLLILVICLKIFYKLKKRIVFNTILCCSIGFYIQQLGFTKYFYSKKTSYGNFFNNTYSIIILYFTPMLFFLKDFLIDKILKSEIHWIVLITVINLLEGIIYIILKIILKNIFHRPTKILFEGFTVSQGFYSAFFLAKDIIDFIILSTKFNLLQKGIGKPIGQVGILFFFICGFVIAYPLYGYTIISIAGNAFVLFAYIILLNEADDMELTKEIFVIDNSKQKLHEEKAQLSLSLSCDSKKQKTYNHNCSMDISDETLSDEIPSNETPCNETPCNETPSNATPTPNDLNINNSINKTSNYNYEEEIAELEEEILMYKNDKKSLESQFNSLKSEKDSMTNEINNLKNENKNLLDENDTLMTNIAKIEIEIEKYKKE